MPLCNQCKQAVYAVSSLSSSRGSAASISDDNFMSSLYKQFNNALFGSLTDLWTCDMDISDLNVTKVQV